MNYLDFSAQKRPVVRWVEASPRHCSPSEVFDRTPEKVCHELESLDQQLVGASDHIIHITLIAPLDEERMSKIKKLCEGHYHSQRGFNRDVVIAN